MRKLATVVALTLFALATTMFTTSCSRTTAIPSELYDQTFIIEFDDESRSLVDYNFDNYGECDLWVTGGNIQIMIGSDAKMHILRNYLFKNSYLLQRTHKKIVTCRHNFD